MSISKREFYSKTGISRGTLENPSGITEDTLAKFIATFPEISLNWLILGQEEKVASSKSSSSKSESESTSTQEALLQAKDTIILLQQEQISLLKEKLAYLKKETTTHKKEAERFAHPDKPVYPEE